MRASSERTVAVLTAADNARLAQAERQREHDASDVLRTLDTICRGDIAAYGSAEAVVDALKAEHYTPIPAQFRLRATEASASRERSAGRHSQGSPSIREVSQNTAYERQLALREAPGAFRVPGDRPLGLGYDAQCDLRYVSGERRRSSLHLTSGYAPLFSHCDDEPDPENPQMRFLHPEPGNPRETSEQRAKERASLRRKCDPELKKRINEPTHMPELNKKVGADFVPTCADKPTAATVYHRDGNQDRMKAAREKVLSKESPMR